MRWYLLAVWALFSCVLLLFCGRAEAAAAEITGVRVNEESGMLRIVVDMSREAEFSSMALSNPDRIAIDVKKVTLSPDLPRERAIGSSIASKIRFGQFDDETVRIVIETGAKKDEYRIFTLGEGAHRLVIDIGKAVRSDGDGQVSKPSGKKSATPADDRLSGPAAEAAGSPDTDEDRRWEREQERRRSERERKRSGSLDEQIASLADLTGRKITIDPGHGGNDAGAIGPTGLMEKTVTLRVARELKKILEKDGATVYMTRTTDTEVSPKKAKATDTEELQARCDFANRKRSDIFISIHMDSFTNKTAHGTTGYYAEGSSRSRLLADRIRQGVMDQLGTASRGTQSCKFYVVEHTDMPATLVELAFISNVEEEKLMGSDDGVARAAQGIADGIEDFFG